MGFVTQKIFLGKFPSKFSLKNFEIPQKIFFSGYIFWQYIDIFSTNFLKSCKITKKIFFQKICLNYFFRKFPEKFCSKKIRSSKENTFYQKKTLKMFTKKNSKFQRKYFSENFAQKVGNMFSANFIKFVFFFWKTSKLLRTYSRIRQCRIFVSNFLTTPIFSSLLHNVF